MSASWPSFTKAAFWPSRTVSFAPILISLSRRGKRYARRSLLDGSVHSMMSISSPLSLSQRPMVVLPYEDICPLIVVAESVLCNGLSPEFCSPRPPRHLIPLPVVNSHATGQLVGQRVTTTCRRK